MTSKTPHPDLPPTLSEVKLSPRWILRVGDYVKVSFRPNGRRHEVQVNQIHRDTTGEYSVSVTNPLTRGVHTMSMDRVQRSTKKAGPK